MSKPTGLTMGQPARAYGSMMGGMQLHLGSATSMPGKSQASTPYSSEKLAQNRAARAQAPGGGRATSGGSASRGVGGGGGFPPAPASSAKLNVSGHSTVEKKIVQGAQIIQRQSTIKETTDNDEEPDDESDEDDAPKFGASAFPRSRDTLQRMGALDFKSRHQKTAELGEITREQDRKKLQQRSQGIKKRALQQASTAQASSAAQASSTVQAEQGEVLRAVEEGSDVGNRTLSPDALRKLSALEQAETPPPEQDSGKLDVSEGKASTYKNMRYSVHAIHVSVPKMMCSLKERLSGRGSVEEFQEEDAEEKPPDEAQRRGTLDGLVDFVRAARSLRTSMEEKDQSKRRKTQEEISALKDKIAIRRDAQPGMSMASTTMLLSDKAKHLVRVMGESGGPTLGEKRQAHCRQVTAAYRDSAKLTQARPGVAAQQTRRIFLGHVSLVPASEEPRQMKAPHPAAERRHAAQQQLQRFFMKYCANPPVRIMCHFDKLSAEPHRPCSAVVEFTSPEEARDALTVCRRLGRTDGEAHPAEHVAWGYCGPAWAPEEFRPRRGRQPPKQPSAVARRYNVPAYEEPGPGEGDGERDAFADFCLRFATEGFLVDDNDDALKGGSSLQKQHAAATLDDFSSLHPELVAATDKDQSKDLQQDRSKFTFSKKPRSFRPSFYGKRIGP